MQPERVSDQILFSIIGIFYSSAPFSLSFAFFHAGLRERIGTFEKTVAEVSGSCGPRGFISRAGREAPRSPSRFGYEGRSPSRFGYEGRSPSRLG
ncbi:MAG: hypothetical protein K2K26_00615 [Muribaculaceae bacterium]|nr:hypothetical protein [Muribaculaceae bacterium]